MLENAVGEWICEMEAVKSRRLSGAGGVRGRDTLGTPGEAPAVIFII
jgi:hypothetical protein